MGGHKSFDSSSLKVSLQESETVKSESDTGSGEPRKIEKDWHQ
jgi:hypothetical protein